MIGLRTLITLAGALAWQGLAVAQQGDRKGETQVERVPREKIPPAPPLPPQEALRQFQLAPGFRVELVASEPLVENPVVLQFDPDGRLWVVEMRSYMPTADGVGETNPISRISILEDANQDGLMDKRKVFLADLVLPRALLLIHGGALVCEPPNLWFYPNQNDTAGPRELVSSDFAKEADPSLGARMNVEHGGSSLLLNLDNWIYCLHHPYRYRRQQGKWQRELSPQRAQWGLAQDDFGRLFFTANSDHLRGDLIPAHYFSGYAGKLKVPGLGVQIATNQTVWPSRVNPGVNRGYEAGVLRPDGTLQRFTAAGGTVIYRGDLFPPDFYGNAFVCEPAGNFVRRDVLTEQDGLVRAQNPYHQTEFLTSRDELFRPVNVACGPDGALYIADMYHGIIQHRVYVTSYLRAQAESRGLPQVFNRGRIWRVVPQPTRELKALSPRLAQASTSNLVAHLTHPNGWWRDVAQRLLLDRADPASLPALRQLAASEAGPVARLHALWTLEGLGQLTPADLETALREPAPKLRAGAVRLAEPFLTRSRAEPAVAKLYERMLQLADEPSAELQIQVALTLSLLWPDPRAKAAIARLAQNGTSSLARELAAFNLARLEPNQTPTAAPAKARPLTEEEQRRFESGKTMYEATCLACHQVHGLGQPGIAPPLVDTEWVKGSDSRLIRIVLNGLRGPIKVKGETFELDMPSLGVLDDDQIAAVLTYIRREWGHTFEPVTPAQVKKVREETANREDAWTMEDLLKVK
jgi:putative membrane-bound dehydrogenase-like protein